MQAIQRGMMVAAILAAGSDFDPCVTEQRLWCQLIRYKLSGSREADLHASDREDTTKL